MKKLMVINTTMLLMLFFSFLSAGCHKDESTEEPESDMTLVGNWKLTKMISEYQGESETFTESQLDSMGLVWNLKMENDGTAQQITNIDGPTVTMPGTWSTSANQLTLMLSVPSGESGTIVYEYAVEGNLLKLNWEMPNGMKFNAEFTKQ